MLLCSAALNTDGLPSMSYAGVSMLEYVPHVPSKWPLKSRYRLARAPGRLLNAGTIRFGSLLGTRRSSSCSTRSRERFEFARGVRVRFHRMEVHSIGDVGRRRPGRAVSRTARSTTAARMHGARHVQPRQRERDWAMGE